MEAKDDAMILGLSGLKRGEGRPGGSHPEGVGWGDTFSLRRLSDGHEEMPGAG